MFESAHLKIDRATKHIVQLNELIRKTPPFTYVVEADIKAGERATYAKKNEAVIAEVALISGDAFHNIRSALDHAYWERVSPFATSPKERRAVQFPFSETAARLEERVKNRLADRVSPAFFKTLVDLKPHGEAGGNKMLYLIHEFDVLDKHKLLVPTGDYTHISADIIRRQIPDFPTWVNGGYGQNSRDVVWDIPAMSRQLRRAQAGGRDKFEQELDVPVNIVLEVGEPGSVHHLIPTLHQLVDLARSVLVALRQ